MSATYDIYLDGHLDPSLLALVAEYDLEDLPARVALHGLPADAAFLEELLGRAQSLGVTVVRIRRSDDDIIGCAREVRSEHQQVGTALADHAG